MSGTNGPYWKIAKNMISNNPILPEWVTGEGPNSHIVISTRARLARNLSALPFPTRASGEDLTMIVREVRRASSGLLSRFPGLITILMDKLGPNELDYLLDSRLVSIDQVSSANGRAVITEPGSCMSIMVNEEDHVRLQAILPGLACDDAWGTVDWADDVLSGYLDYGFDDKLGYLTASLSNVGTGLRVSVMMHLAGLSLNGRLSKNLRAAYDLGVSVRGLYGEGTAGYGDLFQVSNENTLGINEQEIVERVRSVAEYLLCEENAARKELLNEQRKLLVDLTSRALKALQGSIAIGPEQAIKHLSHLRLASELGLVNDCPRSAINELLTGIRAWSGDDYNSSLARAELMRRKLEDAYLTSS